MVGKRSVKAVEIRAYIKTRCQLGVSEKEIFDELCIFHGLNKFPMPLSRGELRNLKAAVTPLMMHQNRDAFVLLLLADS